MRLIVLYNKNHKELRQTSNIRDKISKIYNKVEYDKIEIRKKMLEIIERDEKESYEQIIKDRMSIELQNKLDSNLLLNEIRIMNESGMCRISNQEADIRKQKVDVNYNVYYVVSVLIFICIAIYFAFKIKKRNKL